MALVNCPECAKEISDKAESCPLCGYPVRKHAVKLEAGHLCTTIDAKGKSSGTGNVLKWGLAVIILIAFLRACSGPSITKQISAPTSNDPQYEIAKVFAANKMTGCGEFTWTANPGQNSEYTVKCSSGGLNWTTYTVWTKTERVVSGVVP